MTPLEAESLGPPPAAPGAGALLEVSGLRTVFHTEDGDVKAVDGVDFTVAPREVFAIVGESGSGKTVTALSILGLVPKPAGEIVDGVISFRGTDLRTADPATLRDIRGNRIAMIFQDPLTSLNPVQRVGEQIAEVYLAHGTLEKDAAAERAIELLDMVGIPQPRDRARNYPHEFSGGMRQRAMIAMAIALDPDLIIADEPTTALDVTIQAQVLEVLLQARDTVDAAIMLITHDLGVVAGFADRVMVMYAGKKVEEADVGTLFAAPKHPYTWGLLESTTRTDRPRMDRLTQIPGAPPSLLDPPPACRFAPRCGLVQPVCEREYPETKRLGARHEAACHFSDEPGFGPGVPSDFGAGRA